MIGRFSDTSVYREIFQSKDFFRIISGGILIPLGFYLSRFQSTNFSYLPFLSTLNIFLILSAVINGLPIIKEAIKGVLKKKVNVDELVSIAILACLFTGNYFEAALVSFIMVTGSFLEEFVSDRARSAIETLIKINPKKALVERGLYSVTKNVKDIVKGEVLIVKAGEIIPLDGVIRKGQAYIDESLLTGEPLPVRKQEGDELCAGTINVDGLLRVEVTKNAKNSTLSKIIRLVENAENSKVKSTKIIDKYASAFTPTILLISILTFVFTVDINRAITVLVVGCPCSFLLAGPVATVAAVARAARSGIMVKGGIYLEKIADASCIFFDKTGTITMGKPVITNIKPVGKLREKDLITIAASVEKGSTHPIAESILEKALELDSKDITAGNIKVIPGKGVKGVNYGKEIMVSGGDADYKTGDTSVIVTIDNKKMGEIILFDKPRPGISKMIDKLYLMGIKKIGIVSGDSKGAVEKVADLVGADEFYFRHDPEEKMKLIKKRKNIVYVGDGINDAPALKAADVGISMGLKGSSSALETSDIVLMNDNILLIPFIIKLSRKMSEIIKTNIWISLGINVAALLFSVLGLLNPIAGAIVHNLGSLLVVSISSSLIFTKEYKKDYFL